MYKLKEKFTWGTAVNPSEIKGLREVDLLQIHLCPPKTYNPNHFIVTGDCWRDCLQSLFRRFAPYGFTFVIPNLQSYRNGGISQADQRENHRFFGL